jgi:hypothetical protein
MELILTIISVNLCYIGYILNKILKQFKNKQEYETRN